MTSEGPRVRRFIESFCRLSKGEWAGQLVRLRPWQRKMVDDLFQLGPDGLRRHRIAYIGLPRKNGKGLDVTTPMLTARGWTVMGDVRPGDKVHTVDGTLTDVVAVSSVQHIDCYRVTFSDGQSLVCDSGHLWTVFDRYGHDTDRWRAGESGAWRTIGIETLAATYRCGARKATRYSVEAGRVVERDASSLPIDPYLLGVWLGDGSAAQAMLTTADPELVEAFAAGGYGVAKRTARYAYGIRGGLLVELRRLGVLGDKHVPESYLTASALQRLALLQGLMDTDGGVIVGPNTPRVEFCSTDRGLAEAVLFLARSLGWKTTIKESRAMLNGKDCGARYRVCWTAYADRSPFRLDRKTSLLAPPPARPTRAATIQVRSVERVPTVPTRCIQVAHESGQYLAGAGLLPTHNSTFGSALAVYLTFADNEPGAEIYSCAGDKDQARIVFKEAKAMIEAEPELMTECKLYRDAIEVPATGAIYRVVSADAKLKQGLNPSGVLFDEVHVQPNGELWAAMQLGMGARRQPLLLGITTAGFDEESLAYRLYEYGRKVESGEVVDPAFFFRWWQAPAGCDYRDPAAWAAANPQFGDTLKPEQFEIDAATSLENDFRRYRLNQWTSAAVAWLPSGAWDACAAPELELDPAAPVYVAVDVGLKHDSSAVAVAQKQGDRTVLRVRVWENPYPAEDPRHGRWKLNIEEIEEWLIELRAKFPAPATEIDRRLMAGPEFAYDPFFFERSAQMLEGAGLAMVEYPQNDSRMVPASQALYELAVTGQIAHNGDPALARHIANVTPDQKHRGQRISKPRGSRKRIDAAIAAAIAVYRAQQARPDNTTVYSGARGLLTL